MQDHQLTGLLVLLAVSVVANALVHWLIICRALYGRGSRFPTGFLVWRVFREQRAYREMRRAHSQPLDFYYLDFILAWFNLLLALTVVLIFFYNQTHEFQ